MGAPPDLARQQFRLVKSALPALTPMQRHGYDQIERLLTWQSARQQSSQRRRQRLDTAILEQMNQLAQLVFVEPEGVRCVESANTAPAQRTPALIIQGEAAQERSAALDAINIQRPEAQAWPGMPGIPERARNLSGAYRRPGTRQGTERKKGQRGSLLPKGEQNGTLAHERFFVGANYC